MLSFNVKTLLFKDLGILEKQRSKGNVTQTVRPFKTN